MGQISVGFQGGNNLSKMDFTNNQDYRFTEIDNQQGFIGGLVVQFLGEKHAGVQAEINYSQRGWIENDTTGANTSGTKIKWISWRCRFSLTLILEAENFGDFLILAHT
jgi:hypothetical protein